MTSGLVVDSRPSASPPPPQSTRRRWVAVGTVVAVAAAILVAVVVIAPWRSTPHRDAPAATAPAGMRWVSSHGITLTVPATWSVGGSGWPEGDGVVFTYPCEREDCYVPPPTTTVVSVEDLPPLLVARRGTPITVGGHPAWRYSHAYGRDEGVPDPPVVAVELPDAGVKLTVFVPPAQDTDAVVQRVLDGIEYTPVDQLGCTVRPVPLTGGAAARIPDAGLSAGVLCEYGGPFSASGTSLLGSRVLTGADLTALRAALAATEPATGAGGSSENRGGHDGMHVYRLTRSDGSTMTVDVDLRNSPVVVTDGDHIAVLPDPPGTPVDVPHVYPDR